MTIEVYDMYTLIAGILIGAFIAWIFFTSQRKTPSNPHAEKYTQNGVYNPPGQHKMILKESLDIMDNTTNPETFFSRAKLALDKAKYCYDEPGVVWQNLDSAQIYRMLSNADTKSEIQKIFITHLFDCGKEDQLTFALDKVGCYLTEGAKEYFLEMLAGKQYHFCQVSFENQKLYTYVTKERSVKKEDIISIPVVNGSKRIVMVKQVVETFDAPLDELEFPLERLRCVEDKINIEEIS